MFSRAIITDHLWVPTVEIPDLEKAKSVLTVTPKYSETPIPLWKDSKLGVYFGIPLYHYRFHDKVAEELVDKRSAGLPLRFGIKQGFREGQKELLDQFDQYHSQGMTGFVIQAPPGFGKTFIAINMIARLGRTALVVVPRSNLATQWRDRFLKHTDLLPEDVGVAIGGSLPLDWKEKAVIIGLVHTLALDRFGWEFKKHFGTVVFDEVDRSVPPQTFAPVAALFPSKYRIGVSATMRRQDAMEVVFEKHIGQCFIKGKDANRMKPRVLIHEFVGYSGKVFARSALNARGQLLSRLAGNEKRTALIAKYAKSIAKTGRRQVILSDRIDQLQEIKKLLIINGWVDKKDIGFYVRRIPLPRERREKQRYKELSSSERERVAKKCSVILATYGMFAIGTDIPELAGLIYATPMSETEQSKGRVERELAGKSQPVVVDIVDVAYDMTKRWGAKRERQYIREGLEIKKVRG